MEQGHGKNVQKVASSVAVSAISSHDCHRPTSLRSHLRDDALDCNIFPLRPLHLFSDNIDTASMPLPYAVAPILSITPPVVDTSRYRLKHFARWIRDDLDMRVAREGPDILRPDDVLTLHELFVTLRQSTSITALDLRATGIHKAVKDIAGIATRWPRRLCDDCDKIITIWKSRFGRFKDLHPFLYGRGGRLEGIASVSEHTAEVWLRHLLVLSSTDSRVGTPPEMGRKLPRENPSQCGPPTR